MLQLVQEDSSADHDKLCCGSKHASFFSAVLGLSRQVRMFFNQIVPLLELSLGVERSTHEAGVAALLTAYRRLLSLVDCVGFVVVRQTAASMPFFRPTTNTYA